MSPRFLLFFCAFITTTIFASDQLPSCMSPTGELIAKATINGLLGGAKPPSPKRLAETQKYLQKLATHRFPKALKVSNALAVPTARKPNYSSATQSFPTASQSSPPKPSAVPSPVLTPSGSPFSSPKPGSSPRFPPPPIENLSL